jgi:hypothetical protein
MSLASAIRPGTWFGAEPLRRIARLLLLLQAGFFLFCVAGTHGAFAPQPVPPTTTDFASFYSAGLLADRGEAARIYDQATLRATGQQAIAPGIDFNPFLNPPPFLLVCAPLAELPYLPAFILFEAATALLFLAVTTRIAGGGRLAAMLLASIPSAWWAAGWGQNSFLTASLMGLGTALLATRPWAAGAVLGALCIKPHFGILLPVAFIASGNWRACLGAALGAAGLSLASALIFGLAPWQAFLAMALHARSTIESGRIAFKGHVDIAGAARLLGAAANAGWLLQAGATLLAAACVAWAWRSRRGTPPDPAAQAAVLIAGSLAAMPFLLFYDLTMAGVAAAWLARTARLHGWRAGEPEMLAWVFAADLVAFPAASLLHLAIGAVVAPLLLWLALRRLRPD